MEFNLSLEVLNNVAEIDIVYKRKVSCKISERPLIKKSEESYQIFLHYWDENKIELIEEFKVLFLNNAGRVLQIYTVSQGGITGTVADPRIILSAALKVGALSLILCHNHPSGSLRPSVHDEQLTMKIKEAAKYFDIKILDHLIISAEGYYSFSDEGLL